MSIFVRCVLLTFVAKGLDPPRNSQITLAKLHLKLTKCYVPNYTAITSRSRAPLCGYFCIHRFK